MKKEKKRSVRKLMGTIVSFVLGGVLGGAMVSFLELLLPEGISSMEKCLYMMGLLVFLYLGCFIHIVAHEAGHLVFGLLTGYTFSSFRVGSFMLLKENGKLVTRKLKIAGTGGQCLMAPPEMVDGKFPVVLYNLGGSIANLVLALLFAVLLTVIPRDGIFALFCYMMVFVGVMFALLNAIPMHTDTIDNDGYNALSLGKNREAMEAFWLQMKINEQLSKGLRLKDMPDEWFRMPSDEAMKNNLVASMGVIFCNRLMDQGRYGEADALMAHLLEIDSGMVGVHRNLVICDRMYFELIGRNRREVLDGFYTKEQQSFMKSMKKFPSVIRTQYAYALLAEKDREKAEKALNSFEKVAKTYPYPNDINAERELMELAAVRRNIED